MATPYSAFLEARNSLLGRGNEDQDKVADAFRWPVLTSFNWALDYFDRIATDNDKPALWLVDESGNEERYSFGELSRRSNQVANHLRSLGVHRGDTILMILGNEVALWETMLAAFKLGAVVIPATEMLTPSDIMDRLERGNARHVVVNEKQVGKFASLSGQWTRVCTGSAPDGWVSHDMARTWPTEFSPDGATNADDPLLLYFTSGTTAQPKLVLHTHQSYPVGHLSTMYWLGLRPGDVHMNISSPGWAKHAWSCFFAPWNAQACIFIKNTARFSAVTLLATLERYPVTSLCAPPTVWRMLVQEDLPAYRGRLKLREIIGAGEPLNPEVIETVRAAWGLMLRDGYGQTETTAQIGNAPGQSLRPGSMGRALPGYEIALLDAEGHEANEGEICLRTANRPMGLMVGYQGDESQTEEAMKDGYYRTGDVAQKDKNDYYTFVGRADDVFKSSDYRISPFELESAILAHPAVSEVAVIPSPDARRLVVPKALLKLARGYEPQADLAKEILQFARQQLAPYKRVRRIEFVDDLPKTISGKIRRVELRRLETQLRDSGSRKETEYFEEDFKDIS